MGFRVRRTCLHVTSSRRDYAGWRIVGTAPHRGRRIIARTTVTIIRYREVYLASLFWCRPVAEPPYFQLQTTGQRHPRNFIHAPSAVYGF